MTTLDRRRALYDSGATDKQLAEADGVTIQAIGKWRTRHGLRPAGWADDPRIRRFDAQQHAARTLLYQMRYSDRRIAREQGVWLSAVQRWRKRRGLPPHGLRSGPWKKSTLSRDTTLDRIKRAIGRALPRDIADDAVGDLYMAVITGEVCLDAIEREARRFGNRVLNNFASKWGARSLDEALTDDGDFTLIDTIHDDSASSWLEEMGATVW